MKINDIDTVDQKFQSEIFIQAKWHDHLIKPDEKVNLYILKLIDCSFEFIQHTCTIGKIHTTYHAVQMIFRTTFHQSHCPSIP